MRFIFGAYVRENGEWRLLWQSPDPTGPHWLDLCGYRHEDKFINFVDLGE